MRTLNGAKAARPDACAGAMCSRPRRRHHSVPQPRVLYFTSAPVPRAGEKRSVGELSNLPHLMTPVFILQIWFMGLLSLGIVGGAVYAAHEWQGRSWGWDPVRQQSVFAPHLGWNEDTLLLAVAVALVLVALFGGSIVQAVVRLSLP